MLGHAIVFVAIQTVFEPLKISSALQFRDLSSFIENLQQNEAKYINVRDDRLQVDKNKGSVAINSGELGELINQVANDVYYQDKNTNTDRVRSLKESKYYKFGDLKNRDFQQLSFDSQIEERAPSKAVLSNLQVNSLDLGLDNNHIFNNNDHKIFIILNPQANLNENDFKDITGLLSQILLGSSSTKIYPEQDNTRIKKELRYKGFIIADGRQARRWNHESKELYSPQNSLEDFKPKRVRSDYGGAGGRTPIPYIGHRDIYERE